MRVPHSLAGPGCPGAIIAAIGMACPLAQSSQAVSRVMAAVAQICGDGFRGTISGGICYTGRRSGLDPTRSDRGFATVRAGDTSGAAIRPCKWFAGMHGGPGMVSPGAADVMQACGCADLINGQPCRNDADPCHHPFAPDVEHRVVDGKATVTKAGLHGVS